MSRRPKRKPYLPRVERLEIRKLMSRSAESPATRAGLDALAWGLLEVPGLAAERHLGGLAAQLGGKDAADVSKQGLGQLLAEQLVKEPGYAAKHGLTGLLRDPAKALSAMAIGASPSRSSASARPDLEAFAWALLDRPGVVRRMGLGALAAQLGRASAMAIADDGLGGILAGDLSREPGYAAKHGLSGLIPAPARSPSSAPAAEPESATPTAVVAHAAEAAGGPAASGGPGDPTATPDGIGPENATYLGWGPFSLCSGCQTTAGGASPPGNGATGGAGNSTKSPPEPIPRAVSPTNSDIGLADGSYFQDHQLVPYASQGVSRGVDLQYSSTQANPHPIVQLVATVPVGYNASGVTSFTAQLYIDGVSQGAAATYSVSGLATGNHFLVALQANATSLTTGVHGAMMTVVAHFAGGSTSTSNPTATVEVVNASAGPYGAGWSVGGLQAIFAPASGSPVLITAGSQGTETYTSSGGATYTGPPSDPSTLVKNGDGTWTRTYPDGTVLQFNSSGQETSEADRDGNTTHYAYVTTGAAAGALATITDPVGLVTTLAYNGSGKLATVTDPAGRVTTVTVDSNGNLTAIADPDSSSVGYGYSTPSNHSITTEVSPNGATATVTYDSYGLTRSEQLFGATGTTSVGIAEEDGLLPAGGTGSLTLKARPNASATDPLGHAVSFTFDSMYDPVAQADATGATTTTVRNANDWPTQVTDALSRTTTYSYDSNGDVTGIIRPDSSSMSITYGVDSQPTRVVDYRGLITTYALDADGDVTKRTDPDGLHEDWTYNAAGQVLTDTSRNGNTTTYAYDAYGRLTTITYPGAGSPHEVLAYDSAGDLLSDTDELANTTTFTYDQAGRVLSAQDPLQGLAGKATSYTYDHDGNMTSVADALGDVTSYVYDARDRLTTMVDAANQGTGHATVYAYDDMNLVSVTDPDGHATTFSYDNLNRETGSTDALGHHTTIVYDADGEVQSTTDANGNTTTYTYDLDGRLSTVTQPGTAANGSGTLISPVTTYTYNADDQVASVTDALGHTTSYAYNNLGEKVSVTDALNHTTSYGYDNDGNNTTVTDPLGHVTTYAYDVRDRLVGETDPSGGGTTTYTYDNAGDLTTVTDPDLNVTSYTYDANEREATQTSPTGGVTTYTYDLNDNLTQAVDPLGRIVQYGYDADLREVTEKWLPVGGGSAFYTMTVTYDAAGNETKVQDNSSEYTYGYDNDNRLTTINDSGTVGLPQVTMTYGYDNVGNETSLADTEGGVVSYTYDVRNELTTLVQSGTSASPERVDLVYDAAGRMTTLTRYSNTAGTAEVAQTVNLYDAANRLTTTTNETSSGSLISSYAYTLDAADRLTSETRTWNGGASTDTATYTYTNNNQLTGVTHTNSSFAGESFGYDANGNRDTTGYSTGAGNELSTDGTYNYTYDADGNLATKTTIATGLELKYAYDYRNRLTGVQQVTGGVTTTLSTYTYDALNRLIGVIEGGMTRYTLYDGETPLLDFNGSGTVTARYLSVPGAIDEVLARQTSAGVAWYLTDREGSVDDIINNSGSVIDHVDYSAYGTVLDESSPSNGDRFKFAGMEYDGTTGLDYDRARWYDPRSGRFIKQDPTGFAAGDRNTYRYVNDSTPNFVDPTGLGIGPRPSPRPKPKKGNPKVCKNGMFINVQSDGFHADFTVPIYGPDGKITGWRNYSYAANNSTAALLVSTGTVTVTPVPLKTDPATTSQAYVPLTPAQVAQVIAWAEAQKKNPGLYSLPYGTTCVGFVAQAIAASGTEPGDDPYIPFYNQFEHTSGVTGNDLINDWLPTNVPWSVSLPNSPVPPKNSSQVLSGLSSQ